MSDQGEKTEEPTAKKREKFREEGKVAVSKDIGGVALFLAALLVFLFEGERLGREAVMLFRHIGKIAAEAPHTEPAALLSNASSTAARSIVALLWTVCVTSVAVTVAVSVAQTGGNWSSKSIGFRTDRLQFFSGFKRVLVSVNTIQQIGLSLAKAVVLGGALALILKDAMPMLIGLSAVSLGEGIPLVGQVMLKLVVVALVASAALAVIDLLLAQRRIHNDMMMTKQEVKDEHKQQEGDPHVRGRMRQRMREIGRNQMIAAAREADVVVVNPTHYAVALSYKLGQEGAPKLLAKGKDHVAAKIREVARKHQIPIIANPVVARTIYSNARVGAEIPADLYEMVARVLAYLYRMTKGRVAA